MINHITNIVKEEGISHMIMDMKYRMEHCEKFNLVLDELNQEMINRKEYYTYENITDNYEGQYEEHFSIYNRLDMVVTNIVKVLYITDITDITDNENDGFNFVYIIEEIYMSDDDDDENDDVENIYIDIDDIDEDFLQNIVNF